MFNITKQGLEMTWLLIKRNKKITKENLKTTSGKLGRYVSKCKPCYNEYMKLRYEKRRKAIEESRWF